MPCSAFEAGGTFCVVLCLPLVSAPSPVPMPALHTPVVGRDIWGKGGGGRAGRGGGKVQEEKETGTQEVKPWAKC